MYIIHVHVYVLELLWTANLKGLSATQTEGANCVRQCGGETKIEDHWTGQSANGFNINCPKICYVA